MKGSQMNRHIIVGQALATLTVATFSGLDGGISVRDAEEYKRLQAARKAREEWERDNPPIKESRQVRRAKERQAMKNRNRTA